ncbi:MAG: hypothetical protein BJ554DRAFT_6270 [Olpidium bornovanus]|uniref:V-ATPase proteolipid subunit C-like domain-containing protein n=1 Tax=Olpidium bornovanus TaxID=278681 RepID=A0A8H7ZY37_9FUNG|nr:MAG: hypothetical protein BJ554DRAFT_6270 [Olpidium bornovanus]
MAFVFSSKMGNSNSGKMTFVAKNFFTTFAIFLGGLTVGTCNLTVALADAQDPQLFVKILVIEIFSSVLRLFGLIVGLLMVCLPASLRSIAPGLHCFLTSTVRLLTFPVFRLFLSPRSEKRRAWTPNINRHRNSAGNFVYFTRTFERANSPCFVYLFLFVYPRRT